MIPVKGCVKNYHWGKVGEDSYVARFQAVAPVTPTKTTNSSTTNGSKSEDSAQQHLAELWFGSHPSGPSVLSVGDHMIKLDEFLAREPEMAHPDRNLAQVLHKRDPSNYPDSNHKPELAIALTEFHVLCDFRPNSEISHFIKELAPLKRVIGEAVCDQYTSHFQQIGSDQKSPTIRKALGECFKSLMTRDKDIISQETKNLLTKYSDALGKDMSSLITELETLYPGDPGIFAPFFLNYFKLSPGQAIYLKANKLHAYLKGECIECMACSDNVVRAGLTTKFRDIQTLIGMLDYESVRTSQDLIFKPSKKQHDDCTIRLFAPTEEFKVEQITISNKQEYELPSVGSGSFVIVFNGKATAKDFFDVKTEHKLGFGFAGFVPPKVSVRLTDIQGTLVMYRAFC